MPFYFVKLYRNIFQIWFWISVIFRTTIVSDNEPLLWEQKIHQPELCVPLLCIIIRYFQCQHAVQSLSKSDFVVWEMKHTDRGTLFPHDTFILYTIQGLKKAKLSLLIREWRHSSTILDLSMRWRLVVSFMFQTFFPQRKSFWYALNNNWPCFWC